MVGPIDISGNAAARYLVALCRIRLERPGFWARRQAQREFNEHQHVQVNINIGSEGFVVSRLSEAERANGW